ncbi:hypothetical protein PsYK624_079800 [Phanerochaete sordida]|uniref:F-box domain-containing protein n=1 Tax=Phanerochaete sordida TaxID=48140 RepID=A0A9P3GCG6_9APHY|nr:hypothetical protein PsYK624_079800 [Phanerochaete sordida]
MAEAKLPEELIREIIRFCAPPFCAKTFLKFPAGPPDAAPPRSSPRGPPAFRGVMNVLLVSKRWLRIGTPMLWEGVALRKSKHTSAVARFVSSDPAVGRMIHYLRLEGGSMTRDLVKLTKHASNIHTVYIGECRHPSDSYDGLQHVIRYLRPTTLYINLGLGLSEYASSPTKRDENEVVLKAIVGLWTSVMSLHLSNCEALDVSWEVSLHLDELHIPTPDLPSLQFPWLWHWLARSKVFKRLVLHGPGDRDVIRVYYQDIATMYRRGQDDVLTFADERD